MFSLLFSFLLFFATTASATTCARHDSAATNERLDQLQSLVNSLAETVVALNQSNTELTNQVASLEYSLLHAASPEPCSCTPDALQTTLYSFGKDYLYTGGGKEQCLVFPMDMVTDAICLSSITIVYESASGNGCLRSAITQTTDVVEFSGCFDGETQELRFRTRDIIDTVQLPVNTFTHCMQFPGDVKVKVTNKLITMTHILDTQELPLLTVEQQLVANAFQYEAKKRKRQVMLDELTDFDAVFGGSNFNTGLFDSGVLPNAVLFQLGPSEMSASDLLIQEFAADPEVNMRLWQTSANGFAVHCGTSVPSLNSLQFAQYSAAHRVLTGTIFDDLIARSSVAQQLTAQGVFPWLALAAASQERDCYKGPRFYCQKVLQQYLGTNSQSYRDTSQDWEQIAKQKEPAARTTLKKLFLVVDSIPSLEKQFAAVSKNFNRCGTGAAQNILRDADSYLAYIMDQNANRIGVRRTHDKQVNTVAAFDAQAKAAQSIFDPN